MDRSGLPWGTERLALPAELEGLARLDAAGLPDAADTRAAARQAAQVVRRKLEGLPGTHSRLVLVVPDRTRPLPLAPLLEPLFDVLEGGRSRAPAPVLVPASGIHRPMSRDELAALVGREQARRGRLAPHDADDPGCLLGTTPDLVPVAVHPAVAHADAVIVIGRIVFHYLAGFGGGRKLLFPGTASRRTALEIHRRCMVFGPRPARHPRARAGVLEGNPLNLAACAAARLAPPTIGMHVMTSRGGGISRIDVGDVIESHREACETWAARNRVVVGAPLDAVLVAAGGHPTDRNLVQAHKALDAVAPVVRPGGLVILAARCADGIGNPEVEEALRLGTAEKIARELAVRFTIGGHTAWALREKSERLDVRMITDLDDATLALAGIRRLASLEHAARLVERIRRGGGRCALAPRGGSLLYTLA